MKVNDMLAERLDESFTSGWHGPSLYELIRDVSLEELTSRPLTHRHTIWEIVEHVSFWLDVCTQVLHGRKHPKIGELDDWPDMGSTSEDWEKSVKKLREAHRGLKETILEFDHDFTDNITPDNFTYEWMIKGVCNHNLYHTGQVIILRASSPR